jgi:hypothetical protein
VLPAAVQLGRLVAGDGGDAGASDDSEPGVATDDEEAGTNGMDDGHDEGRRRSAARAGARPSQAGAAHGVNDDDDGDGAMDVDGGSGVLFGMLALAIKQSPCVWPLTGNGLFAQHPHHACYACLTQRVCGIASAPQVRAGAASYCQRCAVVLLLAAHELLARAVVAHVAWRLKP